MNRITKSLYKSAELAEVAHFFFLVKRFIKNQKYGLEYEIYH